MLGWFGWLLAAAQCSQAGQSWAFLAGCHRQRNATVITAGSGVQATLRIHPVHSRSPRTLQRSHVRGLKKQCDHHQAVTDTVLHASMNIHPSYLITVMSRSSSPREVSSSLARCTVTTPCVRTARLLLCAWASFSTALVTSARAS